MQIKIGKVLSLLLIICLIHSSFAKVINYPWAYDNTDDNLNFKNDYIGELDYDGKYKFIKDDLQNINQMSFVYGKYSTKFLKNEPFLDDAFINQTVVIMKAFCDNMKNRNKEVYFMIAPTKELVYYDYIKAFNVNVSDDNDLNKLLKLANEQNINIIFPLDTLIKARQYVHTYYTKDSHWNKVGAYLATIDLYKEMGMPHKLLSEQNIYELESDLIGRCFYELDYFGDGTLTLIDTHGKEEALAELINTESTSTLDKEITIIGDSYRYFINNVLSKDFKKTNSIILHGVNDPEILKEIIDTDTIIIMATLENMPLIPTIVLTVNNYFNALNE